MISLSQAIERVEPSPTQAAAARAKELKAEGRDIIAFTVGEPDFDTPDHVKEAAYKAIKEGKTKYTPAPGIPELRRAIVEKLKRDQGLDFSVNQVVATCGGKQAIAAAFAVLLNPGDEVIIPAPYWTSYPDLVKLTGATPVIVQTKPEDGYVLTPEMLQSVATSNTKLIIINSPSNPTGACYSEEQLKDLATAIKGLDSSEQITIMSDEVYEYITFDGFEHKSFAEVAPELSEQTLIINAFSKAYSMTGWRVGYAAGPEKIIKAISTHQSQFTSHTASISQYAAVAAYEDNYAFPRMMRDAFQERLQIVIDAIEEMPGVELPTKPQGAFYTFLRIDKLLGKSIGSRKIETSTDFALYLLEEHDIVCVQGEAFGAPGAIRLSYACSEEQLKKGLARIKEAVLALS